MSVKYGGKNIVKTQKKVPIATTKPQLRKDNTIRTTIPQQLFSTIFPPKEEIKELEWYKDQDGNIQIEVKT